MRRPVRRGRVGIMTIPADPQPAPAARPVATAELDAIARGTHQDPHRVLGPHLDGAALTIRVLRPLADAVEVLVAGLGAEAPVPHAARHEHGGIWVCTLSQPDVPDYRLRVTYGDLADVVDDPYRFLPTVGDVDLHLIAEGRHEELWTVLGANVRSYPSVLGEVHGTAFAVWAPNAAAVRVVGDFNHWQGTPHTMRQLGSSGVWELFVPGVTGGQRYKYEILTRDGSWRQKADPMAKGTETPPATASVVVESSHTWSDGDWLAARASTNPHTGPMSVYEVHLGSWRAGLGYRELADQLTGYVLSLGFTHVQLLPIAEHPFGGSWGYQVSSYYAPTARFGHPDDFRYLVDRLHQAGVGVLVDWVPAHFPKDEGALGRFDGTPLYEHPDPLLGEQPDWGTYVFNFGRNEVRNFLVAVSTAYRRTPGIMMIAEESTAWPGGTARTDAGGLGFGLKWNMGWMNDT